MNVRDSPWFPFDVLAWRSSPRVQKMDPSTSGLYFEMLTYQWEHGSVPATPEGCAERLRFPLDAWRESWPQLVSCFRTRRGQLVNTRIDRLRIERDRFLKEQQARGRLSAKARATKRVKRQPALNHGSTVAQPPANPDLDLDLKKEDRTSTGNKLTTSKEQVASRPTFPQSQNETQNPEPDNFRVIERLAYAVLRSELYATYVDALDALKSECAKKRIDYRSDVIGKAIDSAAHKLGVVWSTVESARP